MRIGSAAGDANELGARILALGDAEQTFWYAQAFGEKDYECLVRTALDGRRSDSNLERLAVQPDHCAFLGSGLHVERE